MARVALRTREECLEAWAYVRPYAEGIQEDRKLLSRLHGGPPGTFYMPVNYKMVSDDRGGSR